VVARVWLGEARVAAVVPGASAGIDDDSGNGGAVAADPLGGGVDHDIGTVLDGVEEVAARAKGVIDHEGDAGLLGNLGDGLKVGDVELGVSNGLDVNGLGLGVDELLEILGLVASHEPRLNPHPLEGDLELVEGATVEVRRRDDVVPGLGQSRQGEKLRSLSSPRGQKG